MVFCNMNKMYETVNLGSVTILILIDGFLQFRDSKGAKTGNKRHNPYFNRWFSAILSVLFYALLIKESQSLF